MQVVSQLGIDPVQLSCKPLERRTQASQAARVWVCGVAQAVHRPVRVLEVEIPNLAHQRRERPEGVGLGVHSIQLDLGGLGEGVVERSYQFGHALDVVDRVEAREDVEQPNQTLEMAVESRWF